jgi:hypothetical protein
MPRCSCGNGSTPNISGKSNIAISGTGTDVDPIVVDFNPDQSAITIATAGALDLSGVDDISATLVVLNANATSVLLPTMASRLELVFQQGAASRTVAWSGVKWPGGTAPTLSTTVGALDWITLIQINGTWYGVKTGAALA